MALRIILPAAALAAILAGCGATPEYGSDSPYYRYPDGSRLVLNRPLEIPAGAATVRLQHGRTVAFGAVQEREPHCIFEIDSVRPGPQRVEPDSFRIVRVQRSTRTFAGMPAMAVHVAFFGRDGGPSQLFYRTEFTLRSERQPGVRSLACQVDQAFDAVAHHLTLPEIRQALGDTFSLQLP